MLIYIAHMASILAFSRALAMALDGAGLGLQPVMGAVSWVHKG